MLETKLENKKQIWFSSVVKEDFGGTWYLIATFRKCKINGIKVGLILSSAAFISYLMCWIEEKYLLRKLFKNVFYCGALLLRMGVFVFWSSQWKRHSWQGLETKPNSNIEISSIRFHISKYYYFFFTFFSVYRLPRPTSGSARPCFNAPRLTLKIFFFFSSSSDDRKFN